MGRIDRVVLWAIGGVCFAALAAAALIYANDWWLSGLVTLSILCWLAGVLAAIYTSPEQRPALVGAVVAGLLYVTLALGPWFRMQVGPWLLTSQALGHVETRWLGRQPQLQPQILTSQPILFGSGTVDVSTSYITTSYSPTPVNLSSGWAVPAIAASQFVAVGHWLFGWIAAAVGAIAAGRIARRRRLGAEPLAKEATP
jgi:hypothetical protein